MILVSKQWYNQYGIKIPAHFQRKHGSFTDSYLARPCVAAKAKRVTRIDTSIRKLIDDMIDTLRADPNRAGLAAPQVGRLLRVAVIELPEQELIILINPEIVKKEGERIVQEGCLSIPGYFGEIKRAVTVKVKAKNRDGKEFRLKAEGLLAQALEQELEHLDGILYIDHLESSEQLFEAVKEEED